jgi:DNA-binding response OmpR family regulator
MIIEDDLTISSIVKKHLEKWDYEVYVVEDFNDIIQSFTSYSPDLVLLDIYLPFFNGFYWCEQIRKLSQIPIIFISSSDENMNIVMAMNMGGDDFINKPFDLNVLTAKIQAIIRRTYSFSKDFQILTYHNVLLNIVEAKLYYQDNTIELTKNELKILQLFFEKPQMIVSRDELMDHLWQSHQFIDDNTLSVNINRLRKKLEDIGLKDFIKTKKGMGYILC